LAKEQNLNTNIQLFWNNGRELPSSKPQVKHRRFVEFGQEQNLNTNIQLLWNNGQELPSNKLQVKHRRFVEFGPS
jgi:ribosomal protein L31E